MMGAPANLGWSLEAAPSAAIYSRRKGGYPEEHQTGRETWIDRRASSLQNG